MIFIEPICLAIVGIYVFMRARTMPWPRLARELAFLSAAGFVGEDSMIRGYGFYSYSANWHLFLDRVPLLIIVIWPVVIHSAWLMAKRLAPVELVPFLVALFILADASLIEPIAVQAGLWRWTEPGLFHVPPIGILGWVYFAFFCTLVLERGGGALVILLAPLGTHLLLIATWMGALRHFNFTVPTVPAVIAIWMVGSAIAIFNWRRALRRRLPFADLMVRVPAALFFFVLVGAYGRENPALILYALAFAPPYLTLISKSGARAPSSASHRADAA